MLRNGRYITSKTDQIKCTIEITYTYVYIVFYKRKYTSLIFVIQTQLCLRPICISMLIDKLYFDFSYIRFRTYIFRFVRTYEIKGMGISNGFNTARGIHDYTTDPLGIYSIFFHQPVR